MRRPKELYMSLAGLQLCLITNLRTSSTISPITNGQSCRNGCIKTTDWVSICFPWSQTGSSWPYARTKTSFLTRKRINLSASNKRGTWPCKVSKLELSPCQLELKSKIGLKARILKTVEIARTNKMEQHLISHMIVQWKSTRIITVVRMKIC